MVTLVTESMQPTLVRQICRPFAAFVSLVPVTEHTSPFFARSTSIGSMSESIENMGAKSKNQDCQPRASYLLAERLSAGYRGRS